MNWTYPPVGHGPDIHPKVGGVKLISSELQIQQGGPFGAVQLLLQFSTLSVLFYFNQKWEIYFLSAH